MARRWVSIFLAALLLANLAVGPSAVLAEVLEHGNEAVLFDSQNPPIEPALLHCPHGCAGHIGQHYQWHASPGPLALQANVSEPAASPADSVSPLHIPTLPFRPPLTASIRS
ncbi:MAG: hypothetical protein WAO95_11045 [Burkholderiales bacterium]